MPTSPYLCIIKLDPAQAGSTLVGTVYSTTGVDQAAAYTMAELGGGEYLYQTTLVDTFRGYVTFSIGATYQTSLDIDLQPDLQDIETAIAALSGTTITVVSPFVTSTDLELIQGDDYTGADKLLYGSTGWNLTGQSLSVNWEDNQNGVTSGVASTLAYVGLTSFSWSIGSTSSAQLSLGTERYTYQVRGTSGSDVTTLVRGKISVVDPY